MIARSTEENPRCLFTLKAFLSNRFSLSVIFKDYPEVAGVKDISQMLGISPKRVRQLV